MAAAYNGPKKVPTMTTKRGRKRLGGVRQRQKIRLMTKERKARHDQGVRYLAGFFGQYL